MVHFTVSHHTHADTIQVARDHQLLYTARDYFQFATTFFEVIDVSATHVYHSALGLSPLSSIVRKLYHSRRPHLLPRVVVGVPDSWDPSTAVSTKHSYYLSFTWSPCGQFVAVVAEGATEIWDALTLKLVSTLQPPKLITRFRRGLAYSPDGRSLAGSSDTAIVIWDTQTGGLVKTVACGVAASGLELVWSLDGKRISAILSQTSETITVHTYDVASGATLYSDTLPSGDKPCLWAHNNSFRIATTKASDRKGWTIDIFEIGSTTTKIESFHSQHHPNLEAFSPTSYRISVSVSAAGDYNLGRELLVLDVRNLEVLLRETGSYGRLNFSPDGNALAAFSGDHLHIWRYNSGRYTRWKEFRQTPTPLQFSPNSLSILGCAGALLRVLHLDHSPVTLATESVITIRGRPLDAFSPDGTYIVTGYTGESTVTITNLRSQIPSHSQFIDTELEISAMALTGNVLLVKGSDTVVPWLLAEDGVVNGILGNTRADRNDSLWDVSPRALATRWTKLLGQRAGGDDDRHLEFSVEDEIGAIKLNESVIRIYHTRTGEIIESIKPSPHLRSTWYHFHSRQRDGCDLYHRDLCKRRGAVEGDWSVSQTTLRDGWVKDPEGRHRLWLHGRWRSAGNDVNWLHNATTLRLRNASELVIVKF